MNAGMLMAALDYAKAGYRLFPQDRNKHPCIKDWPHRASSDPLLLRSWWKTFPSAN